ncbi:MAG: hypothetical protein WAQ53_07555 [Thiofilum sp.]|uniref:hypothetical protein n=1 Tax=Thiofilum sp. TaxID=2212733 RepID=UPI0025F20CD3|nr:hypothetical protein [Thiofilum sp.]MBK8453418.1 hypothetical protein [Thiofilum sp.]
MKTKALASTLLLASLFSMNSAFAASGASGNGCALAKDGQTITVTASLDQGVVNEYHGNLVAGDAITRKITFKYDFSSQIDASCAYGLMEIGLANRIDTSIGPIKFKSLSVTNYNGQVLTKDLSSTGFVALGNSSSGTLTLGLEYLVVEPQKLAEAFSYVHSFDLQLRSKKGV